MLFRRCYLDSLAQASYVLADGDEAAVVDPRRDVDEYLAICKQHGLRLRWALATHVHADFVAGLAELHAATGAEIGMGARFDGELPCTRLDDGHELMLGSVRISVIPTPGHTPESVSYLLHPGEGQADKLLSGDALFLGDVGRPDLVSARGFSARDMAKTLWHSLHDRLAKLPDATEVWPAHGAGSACGTAIGCEESSTIGLQRLGNWAFGVHDPELFATKLIENQRPAPRYFAVAAAMNRHGPRLLAELPALPQLGAGAVTRALANGAVLLDTRSAAQHAAGHWPSAIGIGLRDSFEPWCGALLPLEAEVVVHTTTAEQAAEIRLRLLRIGNEHLAGWTEALPAAPAQLRQVDAAELFVDLESARPWQVIDVRRPAEFAAGHVEGAVHAELGPALGAAASLERLDRASPTAVICETGYRSTAAAALLREAGFTQVANVRDGMVGWRANCLPCVRLAATGSS
ncbi:MAG TPA: MBL fold metallo-hydrolase [Planctomycetota bacterium]|nr:MBL fold metallo-hydrolase [Planctomycetota bacterium]